MCGSPMSLNTTDVICHFKHSTFIFKIGIVFITHAGLMLANWFCWLAKRRYVRGQMCMRDLVTMRKSLYFVCGHRMNDEKNRNVVNQDHFLVFVAHNILLCSFCLKSFAAHDSINVCSQYLVSHYSSLMENNGISVIRFACTLHYWK